MRSNGSEKVKMREINLTKSQKETIKVAAQYALNGDEVTLYRATSMSGLSETLRYRRQSFNHRLNRVSTRSTMILSVTIDIVNGQDNPVTIARYNRLCEIAKDYFQNLKRG